MAFLKEPPCKIRIPTKCDVTPCQLKEEQSKVPVYRLRCTDHNLPHTDQFYYHGQCMLKHLGSKSKTRKCANTKCSLRQDVYHSMKMVKRWMILLRYCHECQAYKWIEGGPGDRIFIPEISEKFQCGDCTRWLRKCEIKQYKIDNGLRRRRQRLQRNDAGKWVRPKRTQVPDLDW